MKCENAILMAAGLGTRMLPLTEKMPKPLIKVFNKSMIETVIDGLLHRGVKNIYVVVGYKKECFAFLSEKYSNVTLIENTEYETKNNISSVYAAREVLRQGSCFICESDLYVADPEIFQKEYDRSVYFAKYVDGYTDDWVVEPNTEGQVVRIGKGGTDTYKMAGISYFTAEGAKVLAGAIEQACLKEENNQLFWDEVANANLAALKLGVCPILENQITELDSVAELEELDPAYKEYN